MSVAGWTGRGIHAAVVAGTIALTLTLRPGYALQNDDPRPETRAAKTPPTESRESGNASSPEPAESLYPLAPGTNFRRHVSSRRDTNESEAGESGRLVYSNRLGRAVFSPGGTPGILIADDIATTASPGCVLDRLVFRVSGDPLGDGSGVGPFSVTFALYSGCPSVGGVPLFTPVTEAFVDNGDYEVVWTPSAKTELAVPLNTYFGISFSRSLAGIVVGAPATLGFSADRFDFPLTNCDTWFGGFPDFRHASFDLEIYARNNCIGGECTVTCSGGENHGGACERDDCPGGTCTPDISCNFGKDFGAACSVDDDCSNLCSTGDNAGQPCDTEIDCPGICESGPNVGDACVSNSDCPDSACSGHCFLATCTRDACEGGSSDGLQCSVDDCPGGGCTGVKQCIGGESEGLPCSYACAQSFPAYKNSKQGGNFYTAQPSNELFADDIRLAVPVDESNPCELVSFEAGIKGGLVLSGAVQATLHTFLDPNDPENGGMIDGTRMAAIVSSTAVTILRQTFDPPIPITTQDLFVVFNSENSFVGAIQTCKEAAPGTTQDIFFIYNNATGQWVDQDFGAFCGTAAFEVAVNCAGSPPSGACCDMIFTDGAVCFGGPDDGSACDALDFRACECPIDDSDCTDGRCVGDAVCRELPEMNCPFPELWQEGAVCKSACIGGENDTLSCTRQADCPGGICPGPSSHPCGTSRCCTPEETCEDLTETDCLAIAPPGDQILWGSPGIFCDDPIAACPFYACLQRRGDCAIARTDPGCGDPFCCQDVCELDSWCCLVEWDEICVREAFEVLDCTGTTPGNDICWNADPNEGALSLEVNGPPAIGLFGENQLDDPPFCCLSQESDIVSRGTIWYTFEATETSARIHTCNTLPPVEDTVIQVFRAADLSTPETACNSLDRIGCNDDAPGCGTGSLADLCVTGLTPTETYYVMVAQNLEFDKDVGVYTLELEAPCTPQTERPPNDDCLGAPLITEEVTPFDLFGSTFDCPGPAASPCSKLMENDLWYDWIAPANGPVRIETCDRDQSDGDQTPPTTLVLYDGCVCPVDESAALGCGASIVEPGCFLGPILTAAVQGGNCYKIRLGGRLGSVDPGDLTISFDACPAGGVSFLDPPSGIVDARQPHPPGDSDNLQGIDRIVVESPSNAFDGRCWSVKETALRGTPNNVSFVEANADGSSTLWLDRPLTPGVETTITYHGSDDTTTTGCFTTHPGDVNADGESNALDIQVLVGVLAGKTTPIWPGFSDDIDQSGTTGPRDLLRLIDLLNDGWLGTMIPKSSECP